MKKGSIRFLQVVIALISIIALIILIRFPLYEGRNAHATLFQVYFNDPFLAYIYTVSLAFFTALYQAFKLLGYIGKNKVFSSEAVKTLQIIKYCAMTIVAGLMAPEAYLFIARPGDDIAGGVAMGLFLIFVSAVVATAAAVFEKLLQKAVDIKSENDLTV